MHKLVHRKLEVPSGFLKLFLCFILDLFPKLPAMLAFLNFDLYLLNSAQFPAWFGFCLPVPAAWNLHSGRNGGAYRAHLIYFSSLKYYQSCASWCPVSYILPSFITFLGRLSSVLVSHDQKQNGYIIIKHYY